MYVCAGAALPAAGHTPTSSSRASPVRSARGSPPASGLPSLDLTSHSLTGANVEVSHVTLPRYTAVACCRIMCLHTDAGASASYDPGGGLTFMVGCWRMGPACCKFEDPPA